MAFPLDVLPLMVHFLRAIVDLAEAFLGGFLGERS